jgi:hypothetical protein
MTLKMMSHWKRVKRGDEYDVTGDFVASFSGCGNG